MVEHSTADREVLGSTPSAPSGTPFVLSSFFFFRFMIFFAFGVLFFSHHLLFHTYTTGQCKKYTGNFGVDLYGLAEQYKGNWGPFLESPEKPFVNLLKACSGKPIF